MPVFPAERAAKRAALLSAVESIRPVLAAGSEEAERLRTLPPASLEALESSGLLRLKVPAELGGAEADPVTQLDVIEAVARIDSAAGWCLFVGSSAAGTASARLPDEALAELYTRGRPPRMVGALRPSGVAVPTDGGYRLTGRWSWGSGIHHAEWLSVAAMVNGAEGHPPVVNLVLPATAAAVHDNWHVMGLAGTGSCDFSVEDQFVPAAFVTDPATALPRRGGPVYRLGLPAFLVNEHAAFALGVARRALDAIIDLAVNKARGYRPATMTSLADRQVFQGALGKADLSLRAARALFVEVQERAWQEVSAHLTLAPATHAELRAAGTLCSDAALAAARVAFRYGAGSAVFLGNALQRCLRDLEVASTHLMISDTSYENHARFLLGTTDTVTLS